MRLKNTWILLVLAAVFLSFFFIVEQPRHQKERETEELSARLTGLTREDIYYVTIQRPEEVLEFHRKGDIWQMISPVEDRANEMAVNVLVASAVDATIERSFKAENADIADFGLGETPDATLILKTSTKDTTLTIRLGGHNITKSHIYAQIDTSRNVLLLHAGLRRYALRDVTEFRDKRVIDFAIDDVKKLEIASLNRRIHWERNSQNRWVALLDGDTIRGDMNDIDAILRRLRGLRVKEFVSDDPAEYARYFSSEKKSIILWIGEEQRETSIFFSTKTPGECYSKLNSSDRITLIDSAILEAFDKTYDDLRDRYALHYNPNEIARIHLETADTTATIIKSGIDWAFANPALGSIEQAKVNALLHRLENLKYKTVIEEHPGDPSDSLFTQSFFKLTLFNWQEDIIDELICGIECDSGKSRYATSLSSGVLAKIDINMLEDLEKAFHNIRSY